MTTLKIQQGGTTTDVEIADGQTMAEALQGQGFDVNQMIAMVDGNMADINTVLTAGQTAVVRVLNTTDQAAAANIAISIGKLPGKPKDLTLPAGATVQNALDAAQLTETDGFELKVNGLDAHPGTVLQPGDAIALVRRVQGNDD